MKNNRVLILGINGQDGSYLAELLVEDGIEVHGVYRRSSNPSQLQNLVDVEDRITLHQGDVADPFSVFKVISAVRPSVIYNQADQDNVDWSRKVPAYNMDVTAGSVVRTLEMIRHVDPKIKYLQPVTALMFGNAPPPQNEDTPFAPQSPYACAKVAAYYAVRHYRREYGLFATNAILYNHDSPRRARGYLLHKLCAGAVAIGRGVSDKVLVGDPTTRLDIGFAGDYVRAEADLMRLDEPGDYIVGTGVGVSILNLFQMALDALSIKKSASSCLDIDEDFKRPGRQGTLIADTTRLFNATGWMPAYTTLDLVEMITKHYARKH